MKRQIILGLLFVSASVTNLVAQQEPQFTQFFDNTLFVNPAYAGSKDVLNTTLMHRQQWVGFEGKPVSSTFSVHSPLRYRSVGVGLTAVSDKNGPVSQNMAYADISYTLKFNNGGKLAFGLKGGFNLLNVTTSDLKVADDSDVSLRTNVQNKLNPNVGFGVYYHTQKFFFGVSTPRILEQKIDLIATNKENRHYFANFGGVFGVSSSVKLRPMVQAKITSGAPISIDASVTTIFSDKLYLGAMYRLNAALGVFAQYQISPQFKVGLASDFGTTAIRNYNSGTFEFLLSYDFIFNKTGIRSPRYF